MVNAGARNKPFRIVIYTLLVALSILFVVPLYWLLTNSVQTVGSASTFWPTSFRLENYKYAVTLIDYWNFARNSIIITAISEACALGDLSENAEYHAAKEAQSLNEGRIMELESLIGRADIIDVSKLGGDTVKFGATVKLIDDDTEEEKSYQIVGEPESDVKSGKVSIGSPIARALIGKKVGDSVQVNTPGGGKSYEIVGVDFR